MFSMTWHIFTGNFDRRKRHRIFSIRRKQVELKKEIPNAKNEECVHAEATLKKGRQTYVNILQIFKVKIVHVLVPWKGKAKGKCMYCLIEVWSSPFQFNEFFQEHKTPFISVSLPSFCFCQKGRKGLLGGVIPFKITKFIQKQNKAYSLGDAVEINTAQYPEVKKRVRGRKVEGEEERGRSSRRGNQLEWGAFSIK